MSGYATCRHAHHLYGRLYVAAALDAVYAAPVVYIYVSDYSY